MEIRNTNIVSSTEETAVSQSTAVNKTQSTVKKLAAMTLVAAASAYGCMLEKNGLNGDSIPSECTDPFACNDGGVAGADGGVVTPDGGKDAMVDVSNDTVWPEGSAGGAAGNGGSAGVGGAAGVGGLDAGKDVAEDVVDANEDVGVDAAGGTAGSGGMDAGGDADAAVDVNIPDSATIGSVTFHVNTGVCSKVAHLRGTGNTVLYSTSSINNSECGPITFTVTDVQDGDKIIYDVQYDQTTDVVNVETNKYFVTYGYQCFDFGNGQDVAPTVDELVGTWQSKPMAPGVWTGTEQEPVLPNQNCAESTVHEISF